MITGIQFQTWAPARDLVELARLASASFETIWLTANPSRAAPRRCSARSPRRSTAAWRAA